MFYGGRVNEMLADGSGLGVEDMRCFVPARDFNRSRLFYTSLGWRETWTDDDGLALLELGGHRIMLQNFYVREFANNFVISIVVRDAAVWHRKIVDLLEVENYPSVRVEPPKAEPWGATVTYAWDPSGVLLQFTQFD